MAIHSQAADCGYESDEFVANTLIDMYAKCGSLVDARRVFSRMPSRNVVSWTVLIQGCVENCEAELALDIFADMQRRGLTPDHLTFVAALKACIFLGLKEEGIQTDGKAVKILSLERGMKIHSEAVKRCCELDIILSSTLVDMYAKCGSLSDARRVFDMMPCHDVVSWTALILGYAESGEEELALEMLTHMQVEGCRPTSPTFVAAVKACINLAAREEAEQADGKLVKVLSLQNGKAVHSQAKQLGYDSDFLLASTLVDMYARCGSLVEAQRVFDKMAYRDVVSWTVLMLGYAESGDGASALELFIRMQSVECEPDAQTFVAALKGCASAAAMEFSKLVNADIYRRGLETDAVLVNCLVDTYGKMGNINEAQQIFDSLVVNRDLVPWNALLAGYSRQGSTNHVLQLFQKLTADEGFRPDSVTMVCILTACSHGGLVDSGRKFFDAMATKYQLTPEIEHYVCMIDMLGRANQLDNAVELVKSMKIRPNAITWRTLLAACTKWKNVNIGKLAFDNLLKMNDNDSAAYSLMSNLYGSVGMWEEQSQVQARRGHVQVHGNPEMKLVE